MIGLFVIYYYRVDFNHAKDYRFANVCVGVTHLGSEDVCEALKILNQFLPLKRSKYRFFWLLLLHFLYIPKFILNHS